MKIIINARIKYFIFNIRIHIHNCRRFCHKRAPYAIARVSCSSEPLDVRLLRRPLACSWRSLSTCNTSAAVALFLYSRARPTSSSIFGCHRSCFRSRFASLFREAFVSASALHLVSAGTQRLLSAGALLSLVLSLVSALLSAGVLLPSLPALSSRLCFACASSLPRLRLSLVAWPSTQLTKILKIENATLNTQSNFPKVKPL